MQMQVWFCDMIWSQGAPLHLPPRKVENSPDPQDGLGRVSYFCSVSWPSMSTGVPSLPSLCTSEYISRNWWTQAAGWHYYWIPCRWWKSQDVVYALNTHCHLYLMICSQILVHLLLLYEIWTYRIPFMLFSACKSLQVQRLFKKCVLNKATYCEHIRSILWCFHWLPLRF